MKKKKQDADPPLSVYEVSHSYDRAGRRMSMLMRSRGFLTDSVIRVGKNQALKLNGKLALNDLSEELRRELDAEGLPTDKSPVMPIELDYGYDLNELGHIADEDVWIDCVRGSTEPLTRHRIAGDLLDALRRLLPNLSDYQLTDVFQAMDQYALYRQVGKINSLAVAGELAKQFRAKGPQAKRAASRRLRELILRIAEEHWEVRPNSRGHTVKTAEQIADKVNQARAELNPGCKPLAAKTIGDQLSVALEEAGLSN
jgi:hypothetical protein